MNFRRKPKILEGNQNFWKETKNFGRKTKNFRMKFDTSGPYYYVDLNFCYV